jgi:hypothetical protein
MRRTLLALFLTMLACSLAGCPFFTREDAPSEVADEAAAPSEAPAVDEHAGHDHP